MGRAKVSASSQKPARRGVERERVEDRSGLGKEGNWKKRITRKAGSDPPAIAIGERVNGAVGGESCHRGPSSE